MAPFPPAIRSVSASDARSLDAREPIAPAARAISIPNTDSLAERALQPRQQNGIVPIPTVYQGLDAGPAPGAVVGIVLGSVLGFIFLIWLLWILSNGTTFIRSNQDEEEDVVVRRHRNSDRRRSSRRTEMSQRSPRRDRVYRQERITRDFPPPTRSPGVSRVRESVIVDEPRTERRVDGDDIVEVIEEHSSVGGAPPRRKSKRASSGYRRGQYSDI
ncbi:hypothetical protein WHR41_00517 [Cladosporium halotolerans]|uniref:Uncharacterized protein n=1 Tax=Cladosporium halotolerans TaxID=1052096 RepID=A0AB34L074_9PEZI